jgi:hypothetical protein
VRASRKQAGSIPAAYEAGVKNYRKILDPSISDEFLNALQTLAQRLSRGRTDSLSQITLKAMMPGYRISGARALGFLVGRSRQSAAGRFARRTGRQRWKPDGTGWSRSGRAGI